MKQIKKERGIPLYLVEFFDYDYDQHILTIQMQSGNKRDFPYVTEEIYNQFKEAMANDASLFTLYTEHTNFSDVTPLDVKDIPVVSNNLEADNKILKVESTVEDSKDEDDYVIISPDKYNRMFATRLDGVWVETCDKNEAMHFNSYKRALDLVATVNYYTGWKVIPAKDILEGEWL